MTSAAPSGQVALTHMGVIRALGQDAVSFLQGQLTQDVAQLSLSEARLAAFCNAKGRMQASFIVIKRSADELLLVCSLDLLPTTLKRLSMFVMRAKAKLSDVSAEFMLHGLAGEAVSQQGGDVGRVWSVTDTSSATASLVVLPPAGAVARALWLAPTACVPPVLPPIDLARWHWLSVRSGIAMITPPIFEAFVPQMLNYESVGGVNFKKGCYPGQEIVARSQFRGTLKRRAFIVHAEVELSIGQEVFHSADAEQPCGLVASAAPAPAGGFDAIVSMQTAAALDGQLTALSANGPALTLLPLPYPLLEDL
jgi:folate-binding protein YgfZ